MKPRVDVINFDQCNVAMNCHKSKRNSRLLICLVTMTQVLDAKYISKIAITPTTGIHHCTQQCRCSSVVHTWTLQDMKKEYLLPHILYFSIATMGFENSNREGRSCCRNNPHRKMIAIKFSVTFKLFKSINQNHWNDFHLRNGLLLSN